MNNEERLDLINKQHCAEELIYKLEIATTSLKKATEEIANYFRTPGEKPQHDQHLGVLSSAFVSNLAVVAVLTEVIEQTFLGVGLKIEKELATSEMFINAARQMKAEKAEKDKKYFERQERQNIIYNRGN